jgi:cysteine desulfurase
MKTQKYFDYAATTPVDERVVEAMNPYFSDKFGNTSSIHSYGRSANQGLIDARKIMADAIGAKKKEIIFTGSATESNNTVLKGVVLANQSKGNHIIISSVEHDCVLNSAKWLEKIGLDIKVTRLEVDKYGMVEPQVVKKALTDNTILVSVMTANNEIGTLQPIEEIGKILKDHQAYFHTDASQSFGKFKINVNQLGIDLLTASAHKIYGPKGAALLYKRDNVRVTPLLHGGGHEEGIRSSTVNVPSIVGFAKAYQLCEQVREQENKRLIKHRDRLIKELIAEIPNSYLNGHPTKRLPNNINLRFDYVEGESIMLHLDMIGFAVSTGSACASNTLQPSHVLISCGLEKEQVHGSIRISLGRWTTKEEVDQLIKELPSIIKKLRKMSPFGNETE